MLYSDLYTAIQNYTENTEASFLANIPTFVQLAEENIYRQANFPLQSKVATGVLTSGIATFTLPSDFLNFDYLTISDGSGNIVPLLNKNLDYIYAAWPPATYRALPQVYNLRDAYTVVFGPTPDQAYAITYQYVYVPQSIVNAGATGTWLGTNAQNALLYGTLVQAYTYMKGEDSLLQHYQEMYRQSLMDAKMLGEGLDNSDQFRNPPPRNLPQGNV